jgi:hypothetical protein
VLVSSVDAGCGRFWAGFLAGCNSVFGLDPAALKPESDASLRPDGDPHADLDRDGIKDVVDSCISPAADRLVDSDGDFIANGVDLCAFDKATTEDSDGDGFGDVCDPYPRLPGDRQRCLMAFTDPDMDVVMWKPREVVSKPWTLYLPQQLAGEEGSIVADWPFESPAVTTYDVRGYLRSPTTGTFDVLPRADLTPQPTDIGCTFVMSANGWSLDTVPSSGAAVPVTTEAGLVVPYRMIVTVAPKTLRNLGCSLSIAQGTPVSVSTAATLPEANLGFAASAFVGITSITIYERDDAPPL